MEDEIRPKALMIPFDKFVILDILPPEQYKNILTKMRQYVEHGEEPEGLEPMEQMAFESLRAFMNENIKTYQRTIEANRQNGRKGGRPRKAKETDGFSEKPTETHGEPNETHKNQSTKYKVQSTKYTDSIESIEIDASASPSPRASKRFSPPGLGEIEAYFAEKGGTAAQAERFRDFYESNGWKVGKNPMKSWKAAASGWMSRDKESAQKANAPRSKPFMASRPPKEAAAHPNDFLKNAAARRPLSKKKGEVHNA
nr:MAG TPA: hypothetical protein [Caudoviricetes sp.]